MNQRQSRKTKREQHPGYQPPPKVSRPKERAQPNVLFVALVALVGIVGMLCLYATGYTLYNILENTKRQSIVRTLPDVRQAGPGDLAILEGRIAASVPARYKDFAAYVRERHTSGKWTTPWPFVDGATPPLAVETDSHVYTIANTDYVFDRLIPDWTDAQRLDEGPTTWRGAIRIQGLAAKGPVMAVGRLLQGDGEGDALVFHADIIVGLSRAEYFDRLVANQALDWKFAAVLALLAAAGLYFGWRGVRRVMA